MRSKKVISILLVLVMMMALVLAGCGSDTPSGSQSPTSPSQSQTPGGDPQPPASDMPDEIVIGILGAFTGTSSNLGRAQQQGVELAVKEINAAGGINGSPVRVVIRDDEADPTKSLTYAEELIENEGVHFIVGPTNSTPAGNVVPYLMDEKMPTFIVTATGTTIINEDTPYCFRILPTNLSQANGLVYTAKERGYERVVILGDTSALGIDGLNGLRSYAEEYGVEIAAEITYKADDADMTPVAQKIKDANADCALFWTLGADGAKIVRALERIGHIDNIDILGYTGIYMANFRDLAGDGADRCSMVAMRQWAIPAGMEELPEPQLTVYKKIEAEYGAYGPGGRDTNPSTTASAYDVMYLIKFAIEQAGSVDPDAIKDAMENHGSEYDSIYVNQYAFAPGQHEGYPVEDIAMVSCTEAKNDLYIQS